MLDWDRVELGFACFLELLARDTRVQGEFEASRAIFFAQPGASLRPQAERRHLEWFLLERPCDALGGVPAVVWQDPWRAAVGDPSGELASAFLESLPGAFEVTSLVAGEGLWVRDLFTGGEHPVAAARAAEIVAVGDLAVGRLVPAGGGLHIISPAVTVLRSAPLLAAVRHDLESMRRARRGVLRIQQLELEHLFHSASASLEARPTPAEGRARAREGLAALGLESVAIDALLVRIARGARGGDPRTVTEIMNELAFDTPVELSSARLVLLELWDVERSALAGETSPAGADPSAALAAFDAGRAQGKDLEQLFRDLERDLGLDEEANDEEDEAGAPDFPGVVGAMVEEFLWETEREEGRGRALELACVRLFGTYAADVSVFEDLGATRLVDFAARWLLDESGLAHEHELLAALDALAAFCRWSEQQHEVKLWSALDSTFEELRRALPRHLRLRRAAPHGPGQGATFEVLAVEPESVLLRGRKDEERRVALSPAQARELEAGDFVRLAVHGRASAVGAGYPAALARLAR